MSDQYLRDRYNTYGSFDSAGQETTAPVVIPEDPIVEKVPVDPVIDQEMPMGGVVAPVGSMDGETSYKDSMFETPTQEIPAGETAAVDEPLAKTVPAGVTIANDYQDSKPIYFIAPTVELVKPLAPAAASAVPPAAALLTHEESERFRTRWSEIQGKFVDEPRTAVQQADALVSEVITQITEMFAKEHGMLDSQWNQGSDVSTEDLRKALQHYRAFFNRLVV